MTVQIIFEKLIPGRMFHPLSEYIIYTISDFRSCNSVFFFQTDCFNSQLGSNFRLKNCYCKPEILKIALIKALFDQFDTCLACLTSFILV